MPKSDLVEKSEYYYNKFSIIQSIFGLTETTAVVFQSIRGEDNHLAENTVGHLGDHVEAMVYINFYVYFDAIFFLKIEL